MHNDYRRCPWLNNPKTRPKNAPNARSSHHSSPNPLPPSKLFLPASCFCDTRIQDSIHLGAVNDEREQTLNQLLAQMDGFEPNAGVIMLAATNRPEVLDAALLRPRRFDRQVVVDTPDLDGREAILKVHARDKRLAPGVQLRRLAQATAGFSGADLANVLNEAALLAARRGAEEISQADLENAVEKVVAGPDLTFATGA